jgi:hypothetical protein
VAGEIGHRHRIDLVEMVEDARLVRADVLAGLRIPHVPGVAGEVDPWVGIEDLADVKIATRGSGLGARALGARG